MPPELVSSSVEIQMINLSDYSLSPEEGVLQKCLTFSPMARIDKFIMIKDLYFFCRNLTLTFLFSALHLRHCRKVVNVTHRTFTAQR